MIDIYLERKGENSTRENELPLRAMCVDGDIRVCEYMFISVHMCVSMEFFVHV